MRLRRNVGKKHECSSFGQQTNKRKKPFPNEMPEKHFQIN